MCLEVIRCLEPLPQDPMVVYLAVNGQRNRFILVNQGLGARVCNFSNQYPCLVPLPNVMYPPTPTMLSRSCARTT